MHGKKERGLDYAPLFRFLLSKVGKDWEDVVNEAKSRLDELEPIYWVVALNEEDRKDFSELENPPMSQECSLMMMENYSYQILS
ncbi:hypothetical protein [Pontibacter russatus]|uniref:hypothetical protein n=1 Tax=Pontibacter russatus TaxID=2694929 RepID=UPI00192A2A35|nr:hypothetical protein [Pontibacter russatus]